MHRLGTGEKPGSEGLSSYFHAVMRHWRRLCLYSSGGDPVVLSYPFSDTARFSGLGALLVLVGVLASISGFFAVKTVFGSSIAGLVGGLFWGLFVYSIDRMLVTSIRPGGKSDARSVVGFGVRVCLAAVIAIIVARPFELRLFEPEIRAHIRHGRVTTEAEAAGRFKAERRNIVDRFRQAREGDPQIAAARSQAEGVAELRRVSVECEGTLIDAAGKAAAERAGVGDTKLTGKGDAYHGWNDLKKSQTTQCIGIAERLRAAEQVLQEREEVSNQRLAKLNEQEQEELASTRRERDELEANLDVQYPEDSFMAQHRALSRMTRNDESVGQAAWLITILFGILELLPVIGKWIQVRTREYSEAVEAQDKYALDRFRRALEYQGGIHEDQLRHAASLEQLRMRREQEVLEQLVSIAPTPSNRTETGHGQDDQPRPTDESSLARSAQDHVHPPRFELRGAEAAARVSPPMADRNDHPNPPTLLEFQQVDETGRIKDGLTVVLGGLVATVVYLVTEHVGIAATSLATCITFLQLVLKLILNRNPRFIGFISARRSS